MLVTLRGLSILLMLYFDVGTERKANGMRLTGDSACHVNRHAVVLILGFIIDNKLGPRKHRAT
jgi:hypothetical protein